MSVDRFKGKTNGGRPRTGSRSVYEQLRARLTGEVEELYSPQTQSQPDVDQFGRVTATPEQVNRVIHGPRRSEAEPSLPTSSETTTESRQKEPSNRSKKQRHPGSHGGPGRDVYVNRQHPYTGGPRGRRR